MGSGGHLSTHLTWTDAHRQWSEAPSGRVPKLGTLGVPGRTGAHWFDTGALRSPVALC